MILPDFIIPSRVNKYWHESGMDCENLCFDKVHFLKYPHAIDYRYNSRGYRDQEWPDDLYNAIWCIGDSYTVGLGSPLMHTWPYILQQTSKQRIINISMDGASNDWIARKSLEIIRRIAPKNLVIHWSFFSRGEKENKDRPDDERLIPTKYLTIKNQFENFKNNFDLLETNKKDVNIVHSFIPNASPVLWDHLIQVRWDEFKGTSWPNLVPTNRASLNQLSTEILAELKQLNLYDELCNSYDFFHILKNIIKGVKFVPQLKQLDRARDGHHYDIITATSLVKSIFPLVL